MASIHNRSELDPPADQAVLQPPPGAAEDPTATPLPPPESPAAAGALVRADDPAIGARIEQLIGEVAGPMAPPGSFNARLVKDLVTTALKLIPDGRDTGELKLITTAIKELRYAYRVFGQYREPHKVSIFGSARTPPEHPDYAAAREFGALMAARGWMVITGAGDGIMKAGHEGPGRAASFGVAIRLPFETTANEVIAGDEKLINFRYFFTRKLMFLSQSEAVALFPGGFGTMDEGFEVLTLIQTGKSSMIPIVMCEGKGENYWEQFDEAMRKMLLERRWISPEDVNLYRICSSPQEAADEVLKFYRIYHSSRYVKDELVIRLQRAIHEKDVERLSTEFGVLIRPGPDGKPGRMSQRGPLEVEGEEHAHLPRLVFTHTRRAFGMVRKLIDRINECEPV